MVILKDAEKNGILAKAAKHHKVDLAQLQQLISHIADTKAQVTKDEVLKRYYPCLFMFVMDVIFKNPGAVEKYMEQCKAYDYTDEYLNKKFQLDDQVVKYTLFIHGYWLPLIDKMSKAGQLQEGEPLSFSFYSI